MKTACKTVPGFFLAAIFALLATGLTSCEQEDSELIKSLDNELYGRWELPYGSSERVTGYTFFGDGTSIQTIYGQDVARHWRVESGSLIFYVDGGEESEPLRYKVHGQQLFTWSDELGDWGAPMTKIN